jgi:hypothetical protein
MRTSTKHTSPLTLPVPGFLKPAIEQIEARGLRVDQNRLATIATDTTRFGAVATIIKHTDRQIFRPSGHEMTTGTHTIRFTGITAVNGCREAFIARPGRVLVGVAVKHAHILTLAELSGEKLLLDLYGGDMWQALVDVDTSRMNLTRDEMKRAMFAAVYQVPAKRSPDGKDRVEAAQQQLRDLMPALFGYLDQAVVQGGNAGVQYLNRATADLTHRTLAGFVNNELGGLGTPAALLLDELIVETTADQVPLIAERAADYTRRIGSPVRLLVTSGTRLSELTPVTAG